MDNKSRDYLANERTFLAYLRTALSFIAFGFVVARFSLFAREFSIVAHIAVPNGRTSTQLGVGMAILGVVVALYGSYRYTATVASIQRNQSTPMPIWAAAAGGIVLATIGIVVAIALFEFR